MRKVQIWSLLLLLPLLLTIGSCGRKPSIDYGMTLDSALRFAPSGLIFKQVFNATSPKDSAKRSLAAFYAGEAFRNSGNLKEAEKWYNNSIKYKYSEPKAIYRKAQMMLAKDSFLEALIEFKNYAKKNPDDTFTQQMIENCTEAMKWKSSRSKYIVENMKIFNTKQGDYAPAYAKKDVIVFTSDRPAATNKSGVYQWTGGGFSDLYESQFNKKSGKYVAPVLFKSKGVNSKYNDGSAQFDNKGNIYCTQCNGADGKGKRCNVYYLEAKGADYDAPVMLDFNNDTMYHCSQPCLSANGDILYFSSDMAGGFGRTDIWFVTFSKKSKSWSSPINAGPAINTDGDEVYPWLHPDGTLFFASNGQPGMGGMDIFFAKGQGKDWSNIKNMKYPINTGGDDFAFICDEKKETGFFTSNRPGGKGNDDIYAFRMAPLEIDIIGTITDCKTNEPLSNAVVTITNSIDTSRIILKTDAKGFYKTKKNLKANAQYSIYAQKREDYYFDSKVEDVSTMNVEVSTTFRQDFCLKQMDSTQMITVNGILYDLDHAEIRPDAALILDSLVKILNKFAKITLELGSHTDCRASYEYNIDLSQRRADSAVDYLVRHGIEKERLTAKGYGETQLVNDCACEGEKEPKGGPHQPLVDCPESVHQLNRRTTVRITGKNYKSKNSPSDTKKPK
jgi:peptidoglycan-associated lipoprotein